MKAALQLTRQPSPPRSRDLLARDESYAVFLHQTVFPALETPHEHRLKGAHELRAAYTCERYEQLTGHAAPVMTIAIELTATLITGVMQAAMQ